jgi:gas vesicle protein
MNQKDCERAKQLYNTVLSCGNDLTRNSSQWLKEHLKQCAECQKRYKEKIESSGLFW